MMLRPYLLAIALGTLTLVSIAQPPPAIESHLAIDKLSQEYLKAVNSGDAKQAASFWAENADYTGPDGVTVRGRAELEKSFAAEFKAHPKSTLELKVSNNRSIGNRAVVTEGTCVLKLPTAKEPLETQFTTLFIREDDGWKIASVREWNASTAKKTTLKDIDWLLGDWIATNDGKELRTTYKWDESKTFLHETYSLTKEGKTLAAGMQIIGANPHGGLRAWLFDRSGATGESFWSRDENRWVIEAIGVLPNGSETAAVNILVPLGPDRFTWQSTARVAGGVELNDTPPVKVTRVK